MAAKAISPMPISPPPRPPPPAATSRRRASSRRAPRPGCRSARRPGCGPTISSTKNRQRKTDHSQGRTQMTTSPRLLAVPGLAFLAAMLAIAAPQASRADEFSTPQKSEIERVVHDYLLAHPEVLQEVMTELEKRQTAAESEKHKAGVKEHAQALFSSPRQVNLGNPQGNVTFVEFFDYNCGYCKRAMSDMLTLMKDDPKLKVVLKEFPVLGPGSVEAAQVAVAVRMQDPTGKKYLDFHQKLLGGRGQADKARALAAAKEAGLDMAKLDKDLASPEVRATLEENFKLAEEMGMNGTPSYVIGKQVVIGAVGLDGLREKIGVARCGKATC